MTPSRNRSLSGASRRSISTSDLSGQQINSIRKQRIISLLGSTLVALSAGSNYAFSSFAPQLQESCHLTSTQINVVGLAGNMGVYCSGPFLGRWVDKRGPKSALTAGAGLVLCGYLGLSFAVGGSLNTSSTLVLAFLNLLTGIGNSSAFTAAMNAQAKSWGGARRGSATALVLSGFGLSAFMYATLSHLFFAGNTVEYLRLMAFGSMASMLVGLLVVKVLPPFEEDLAAASIPQEQEEEGERYSRPANYTRRRTSSDIGARAWSADPDDLSITENEDEDEENRIGVGRSSGDGGVGQSQSERAGLLGQRDGRPPTVDKQTGAIDITGWKLVRNTDFIILFTIMALVSGAGLLLINNVGTITRTLYEFNKSHDGKHHHHIPNNSPVIRFQAEDEFSDMFKDEKAEVQQLQAHQVSVISLGNASGRIVAGLLSDLLVNLTGSPKMRVWLLVAVCLLALTSQSLAATPELITDVSRLLIVSSLTGISYGFLFGTAPVLCFEAFGGKHFSQNWGLVSLSPVVAGNVFNLLFGRVFDSHVPKDSPSHSCPLGEECYRSVFVITAFCSVIALVLSFALIARRAGISSLFRR